MTRQKGFKQLVRERMARTGERYAAARRALEGASAAPAPTPLPTHAGWVLRGGLHPESANLASVLAARGVTSPFTGAPLSEAQVLGIGGGLGAGYILWQWQSHATVILTVGFRNRWQYPVGWQEKALARLGIVPEMSETAGVKTATAALDRVLDAGEPAIVYVDQHGLGLWHLPDEQSGYWGTQAVVFGRTPEGRYLLDDRGSAPFEIDPETMTRARGRISSFKNRVIRVPAQPGPIDPARLRDAYRAGIEDQVVHLRSTSDSFGLPAWRKWSLLLTDERNAKGWPRVFTPPVGLFGTLLSIVEGVDGEIGASGGHLRELYAEFLDDAATVLERPALRDAAVAWREAGDMWEDLADATVPPALPGATEAVAAAEDLHAAVLAGEPGRERARAAARAVWETRDRYAREFPLPKDDIRALFADLSSRLAAIRDAEVEAVEATARAIAS